MRIVFLIVLVCCASILKAQQTNIHFNELDSLQKLKPKKVFVFIHTNWCSYCKAMEEVVFKDKAVAKLLADDYYFVHLDAEEKSPIIYRGHQFVYRANKGFHDLAIELGSVNGKLMFPSTCILSPQDEILYQSQEFINAKTLLKVLKQLAPTTSAR